MTVEVRPLATPDAAAEDLVDAVLAGRHQSRLGQVVDVLTRAVLGAFEAGRMVGVATWGAAPGAEPELTALAVVPERRGRGVGSALVEAVAAAAAQAGAAALWLVTTNDNLDALRLYQRHGFRLVALHPDAVTRAREAKPTIPATGRYGIPLRDELVLERGLLP